MGDFDDADHLEIIAKVHYGLCRNHGEYWDVEAQDPPEIIPTSNTACMWEDLGYQADRLADDLRNALNRLRDGDSGGWRGEAADAFAKRVRAVIRFAREIAHTADDKYDAPTGGDDEEEYSSNFGGSDGGGTRGYKQVLTDAWEAIGTAGTKMDPPPWWETPIGLRGGGRGDDAWYEMVVREDFGPTEGGDASDLDPYTSSQFDGGEISAMTMAGSDGHGGYYGQANASVYAFDDERNHFFPSNDVEYQKVFIVMGLNESQESEARRLANTLADTFRDLAEDFLPAPTAPDIGVNGDTGGFGGGGGGGGGGGPSMPTLPDQPDGPNDPPYDPNDPPYDPNDPPYDPNDPPYDPNDPPYDPEDPRRPPYDPEDPRRPPYDPDDPRQPPYDPRPPGSEWEPDGPGTGYDPDDVDTGADLTRVGGGDGFGGGSLTGAGPGSGPTALGSGAGPGAGGNVSSAGAGTAGAGTAGTGAGAAGPGAAGAGTGRGGMGGMMAPMMGGGAGQGQGDQHERDSWLEEDEDVWGADDDGAPPVIGGSL